MTFAYKLVLNQWLLSLFHVKLCEENGLETSASEFAGSLFHTIDTPQSPIC